MGSFRKPAMTLKPCVAGLGLALALVSTLALAQARAEDCPASSSEDVVVLLKRAPSCLRATQIRWACDYTGHADEIKAIVEKKCKAPPQPKCPAKSTMFVDIIASLNQAKGCDAAMKVFGACEYTASGDVDFGAIVEKKCEADFLDKANASKKRAYKRELGVCDRKYRNESGTMYLSFTAFCRAEVAQRYSRRTLKAKR
jgi:hypothetical protein